MSRAIRRKSRAMSFFDAEQFLKEAAVGRLGTSWKGEPYIVPLNYVYSEGRIYFHCAKKGKKLDCLEENPKVCFEVDKFLGFKRGKTTCSYSSYYRCVMAFGEARPIEKVDDKIKVLRKLVSKHLRTDLKPPFSREELERVEVIEVLVKRVTGKQILP